MTEATLRYGDGVAEGSVVRHPPGWWGMVWLCATEAMLFACLIASYFYLRGSVDGFHDDGGHYPKLVMPLVMTAVLLSSSVTMWWAERGIAAGSQLRLRVGYALTFVLGAAFLSLQAIEYRHNPLGPTVSAYHSVFYTTTTLHGAHVAIGLLMNLFVQLRAWRGHFSAARHHAVQNVALYWHFVDAVWIVILLSLYLSPRLW